MCMNISEEEEFCYKFSCKCNLGSGCQNKYGITFFECECGALVPMVAPYNGLFVCRSCNRQYNVEELEYNAAM